MTKKDIARRASLAPKGVPPLQPPPAAELPTGSAAPPDMNAPAEETQPGIGPVLEQGAGLSVPGDGWPETAPRHRRGRRVSLVVTSPPRRNLARRRASLPEPRALSRQLATAPPVAWVAPNVSAINSVARTRRRPGVVAAMIQPYSNSGQIYSGIYVLYRIHKYRQLCYDNAYHVPKMLLLADTWVD
jgi:hypothetical protein